MHSSKMGKHLAALNALRSDLEASQAKCKDLEEHVQFLTRQSQRDSLLAVSDASAADESLDNDTPLTLRSKVATAPLC
jgi:hypothetical protein